jgi:hypothetical protein
VIFVSESELTQRRKCVERDPQLKKAQAGKKEGTDRNERKREWGGFGKVERECAEGKLGVYTHQTRLQTVLEYLGKVATDPNEVVFS